MKVVENGLIPVYENENKEQLVNARELHEFLEVGTKFTDWIKDRIKKYGFNENEDFIHVSEKKETRTGATVADEYILKILCNGVINLEFISAEEFLKQPVEVQRGFLEWWKKNANEFDLIGYIGKCKAYQNSFPSLVRNVAIDCFELMVEIIPLFTEGQLRKFIEDKIKGHVDLAYYAHKEKGFRGYTLEVWQHNPYKCIKSFKDLGKDLLQAYWKTATQIAKEC